MIVHERDSLRISQNVIRWLLASVAIATTWFSSSAVAVPAFPGCEGYGCETSAGRGGIVCIVTNVNDSGAGSLRECLLMEEPRFVIFRVSGTIVLNSQITLGAANSYVYVAGQTAPGDGIALQSKGDALLLRMSQKGGGGIGAFHDAVFQHLRFRHGSSLDEEDAFNIFDDSHHIIFDHNSITWTGDEAYNLWGDNIHDITFSRNIVGEGIVLCAQGSKPNKQQNYGPLHGGGSPQYRITYHHNLMIHSCIRNVRITSGYDGKTGIEFINEVRYNNRTHMMNFARTSNTGSKDMYVDVVNSYFKRGPDGDPWPVRWGISESSADVDLNLHFVGSTWRNQDGSRHAKNDENDNYKMMAQTNTYWPYVKRNTRISPSPQYPVAITSAEQAYIDVVINEDVGATMPKLDSVDQRLVDDPVDGGRWSASNVPEPYGTAKRETYKTYDVPIDSDNDGVPDDYEVTQLGTNPNSFDRQAVLDHDSDGYSNIEEWIHSISGSGSSSSSNRPNPPTLISAN